MSHPARVEEAGVPLSLHQAVEEVELLLAYAAQRGLEMEQADIEAITRARKAVAIAAAGDNGLNPSVETRFWGAYQRIAKAIKPVSIGSIKASSDAYGRTVWTLRGKRTISRAGLAVRRYQIWAVGALTVLLVVQLYAGVGATILNDLREVQRLSNEKRQEISIFRLSRARLRQLIAETPGASPIETERLQQELTEVTKKLSEAERERNFTIMDLKAKYVFLEYWPWAGLAEDEPATLVSAQLVSAQSTGRLDPDSGAAHIGDTAGAPDVASSPTAGDDVEPPRGALDPVADSGVEPPRGSSGPVADGSVEPPRGSNGPAMDHDPSDIPSVLARASIPASVTAAAPASSPAGAPSATLPIVPPRGGFVTLDHMQERMQPIVLGGTILLTALNIYFLPLVYGLLGACAYVLRTLSREIREYTYSPASEIQLQLRLYLGALSGFAIAWFVNDQTAPTLRSSITPLALAFLAGYSVELVFALMDNLVNAFSRRSEKADPS